MTVKLIHDKHNCINCGACLGSSEFTMDDAGVNLTEVKYEKNEEDKTIIGKKETKTTPELEQAIEICPVQCIRLEE
ncbi:hypothetical protein HN592_03995 [Candidatus Woesearchaeota archaeon]|jgi:ferredoxin|nr:hypothetical protein [Candidatus Woesearchaeota archaeon]MBT4368373.1 hypothetical protein [Candidatus Woesearchaeota archaeon]MBT4712862.1 hypothetical protein [Candidatus Woesearchaeota archaeon]MBT6639774.1 hypothetical protein [Candidatus Woesearchaeota archaeon]MBT7133946.1 hypothetical protein [Candidatus Woesearchaeota archaeon]